MEHPGVDGDSSQNRFSSWFPSHLLPVTSTSWIVALSLFLLSWCFPTLSWLPSLLIFAYLESGGRMRERSREKEVEEEERRKLREEMTRLTMEQKELKIKFEEEVAQHNLGQAIGKETTLAVDFEQSVADGGSNKESLEESEGGLDANLEESMGGGASKLEERVLLRVEAKLEQMVEAEVMLRLGQAEQEQLEKSVKLEQLVEKAVRLRLRAEQNQLDNSSTHTPGAT